MFDLEKLKVGDVFYSSKERNTSFHRKKIHQVIDGEDWFRYDRPLRTYELVEHKVLGIIRKELEGNWTYTDPDGDLETQYLVQSWDSTHVATSQMYFDENSKYFVDKQQALDYIKTLEAEAKELDKT